MRRITPTPKGRLAVEQYEHSQVTDAVADVGPFLHAVRAQAETEDKLNWAGVRLVCRRFGVTGSPRASPRGIMLGPLLAAVPDDKEALVMATIRALIESGYLTATGVLGLNGLPAELGLTDRARTVLDG